MLMYRFSAGMPASDSSQSGLASDSVPDDMVEGAALPLPPVDHSANNTPQVASNMEHGPAAIRRTPSQTSSLNGSSATVEDAVASASAAAAAVLGTAAGAQSKGTADSLAESKSTTAASSPLSVFDPEAAADTGGKRAGRALNYDTEKAAVDQVRRKYPGKHVWVLVHGYQGKRLCVTDSMMVIG